MAASVGTFSVIASDGSTTAISAASAPSNPSNGYRGYDHVTWYVGNAKQAASYFIMRMGFHYLAYRGLETGSRSIASHVVSNGGVTFVFTSPLRAPCQLEENTPESDKQLVEEIHAHLTKHGDAVKDVAFEVDDTRAVYSGAIANGADSALQPTFLRDERDGEVLIAAVKTYGDTTHTLVERSRYQGAFLPGYRPVTSKDPALEFLPKISLEMIDHCVGNQGWDQLQSSCE